MKKRDPQIWSDFNTFIRRNRRRFLIKQTPIVIWLTGLSGSGKTTIATALAAEIHKRGYFTKTFDGDVIRNGINKDLGFSAEDRKENLRRVSEIINLFLDSGLVVICSFISPTKEVRDMVKGIIGKERFVEIFVNCPIEECEKRDVKGLYKRARSGEIKNFTGISSPYEAPGDPAIEVRTDLWSHDKTVKYILRNLLPWMRFKTKFRRSILKNSITT